MLTFITASSQSYFPKFMILYNSIKQFHPESPIICYVTGSVDCEFPQDVIQKQVDTIADDTRARCFLDAWEEGHDRCVWVGADCKLFGQLTEAENILNTHSVIVTTHLFKPLPDDKLNPLMWHINKVGHCNSDILFAKNDDFGYDAMCWYQAMLVKYNIQDFDRGMFYDQSWLGYFPYCFDNVYLSRLRNYNTAYWNVHQVNFKWNGTQYLTDSGPLKIYHFSGFCEDFIEKMSTHQDRYYASGDILKLYREYNTELQMNRKKYHVPK